MSANKELFSNLDETFREKVKVGNNSSLGVKGKGDIEIEVNGAGKGDIKIEVNGVMHSIYRVFYIPDLKSNLLSLGQLQEKGFVVLMQKNTCQIYHPEKGLLMKVEMTSNLEDIILVASESASLENESSADTKSENESSKDNSSEHRTKEPRLRRTPVWLTDYVSGDELSDDGNSAQLTLFADNDPITFNDAVRSSKWRRAMDSKIVAIVKNNTWELTDLPVEEKTIGVKWIYKTKLKKKWRDRQVQSQIGG
ncbi:uncharacterized protein LOC116131493 [Pistacia vera]|uniref:uncharacterized protein LOC116131493 n=1 Tax=Pistacia vera TaxID=55513 RepID=UPI0012630424|nr:uncharacterized protein LOC116131493 [Pistacia vera]